VKRITGETEALPVPSLTLFLLVGGRCARTIVRTLEKGMRQSACFDRDEGSANSTVVALRTHDAPACAQAVPITEDAAADDGLGRQPSEGLVRTIGVLEVLAAIGLIVAPLPGIAAWLALAAAIGIMIVQIGGIILHLRRGEANVIWLNIVLVVTAGVAAWLASVWVQAA
jgi:hypothetical protein